MNTSQKFPLSMSSSTLHNTLPVGYLIKNRYQIDEVLGDDAYCVTYKGLDTALDVAVVIKEFLPLSLASRHPDNHQISPNQGREEAFSEARGHFSREAQQLAIFNHPNIVKVDAIFEDNGTTYSVSPYHEGVVLSEYLKQHGDVTHEAIVQDFILPIMEGLVQIHEAGFLHHDICTDNILVRTDNSPLLIDFGGHRYALRAYSRSITSVISRGYAPPEQYTGRGKQAPYTDLYALGAVMYELVSGKKPVESVTRSYAINEDEADPLPLAINFTDKNVPIHLLKLIDQLLNIKPKHRPQSCQDAIDLIRQPHEDAAPPSEEKTNPAAMPQDFHLSDYMTGSHTPVTPDHAGNTTEKPDAKTPVKPEPAQHDMTRPLQGNEQFDGLSIPSESTRPLHDNEVFSPPLAETTRPLEGYEQFQPNTSQSTQTRQLDGEEQFHAPTETTRALDNTEQFDHENSVPKAHEQLHPIIPGGKPQQHTQALNEEERFSPDKPAKTPLQNPADNTTHEEIDLSLYMKEDTTAVAASNKPAETAAQEEATDDIDLSLYLSHKEAGINPDAATPQQDDDQTRVLDDKTRF